ncbi:hypothetical protein QYF36_019918 [Acer negundo]|nr:hypothetical protein QYF36_019918 [Acer negundo]
MEPTMEKDIEAQTKRAEQSQAATIFKRANRPVTLKIEDVFYNIKMNKGASSSSSKSDEKVILNLGLVDKCCLNLDRQTALFSATQTKKVEDLARLSFQTTPVYIDVDDGRNKVTNEGLQQGYCVVPSAKRFVLLYSFLKRNLSKKVMVFFSSCNSVKFHSELLTYIQVECFDIHGKQKQQKRTTTFFDFCKAEKGILLCTDVAARGLDIPSVRRARRHVQPAPPEFSESDEGGVRHRRLQTHNRKYLSHSLHCPVHTGTRARHWCSGHETEVHALFVGDTLMLSFLLTSGFYIQNVPGFMAWIGYISVSHHAFKLLLGSQYKASDTYSCGDSGGGFKFCKVGEYPAIKTVGLDGQVVSVIVLAAMLVVFRVLAYIALMRIEVTRKQRKFPLFSAEYYKHILCLQVHC